MNAGTPQLLDVIGEETRDAGEVDALCADYAKGMTVDQLSRSYGIHRTTVMRHLMRRGTKQDRDVKSKVAHGDSHAINSQAQLVADH